MNSSPKYWIACSGGVDSIVLLHIMHKQDMDIGILHCNFHLRGEESNNDEKFVRTLGKKLHLPIRVQEFDTAKYEKDHRINTELAARELRYNWFDSIIQNEGATIILGHHYDDQIETFFLQLRRGGKVKGLSGMPVFRSGYFRPLLKYSKEELVDLAQKYKWVWREDKTNATNEYMRNWYRNEILPWLKMTSFPYTEIVPLMHNFQELLRWINKLPVPESIKVDQWLHFPIWYQQHILSEHQLGEYTEHEINRLTKSAKGKFIGNSQCKVWNEGGKLVFVKSHPPVQYRLAVEKHLRENVVLNNVDLFLDAAKAEKPFYHRKWKAGDYFQPLGMSGKKTIGKFLRDKKVPTHQKNKIQVLVNKKDQILGVFGLCIGENLKVDRHTQKVYQVSLKKESEKRGI